jgi:hypothetical protein
MAIGIGAIALAIAAGTGAYAMRGDDAPKPAVLQEADGAPAIDSEGGGSGLTAMCLEGQPDCTNTVDVPYGDFGETEAKCAAGATECVEPSCPPEGCSTGAFAPCDVSDPAVLCAPSIDCTIIAPLPVEVVDPVPDVGAPAPDPGDPIESGVSSDGGQGEDGVAPGDEGHGGGGDPFTGTGCLGGDPCSISSRQDSACLPPDCVLYEDGSVVCTACAESVPLGAPDDIVSSDCPPPPVVCTEAETPDGTVSSDCVYPCPLEPSPEGAEGVPDCGVVPPPFPCPTEDTPTNPADPQSPVCVAPDQPVSDAERR